MDSVVSGQVIMASVVSGQVFIHSVDLAESCLSLPSRLSVAHIHVHVHSYVLTDVELVNPTSFAGLKEHASLLCHISVAHIHMYIATCGLSQSYIHCLQY